MTTRALLDVNVLMALLDADHSLHSRATQWLAGQAASGWASRPQNGSVRVMSHPGYPNPLPVSAVMGRLGEAAASGHHELWADDISLLDPHLVDRARVHGPRPLTEVYLLALAVRRKGLFASSDSAISIDAVKGAQKRHLLAI